MKSIGVKNQNVESSDFGISGPTCYWNLSPAALVEKTVNIGQGKIVNTGALSINTGKFTGRSPKDRYIVEDDITSKHVDWGDINIAISPGQYNDLKKEIITYANKQKELYVRDVIACSNKKYQLKVKVVSEHPWQSLFANNMFLRPDKKDVASFIEDWIIYAMPGYKGDPKKHGLRQDNFSIINFTDKTIIIGGTAYTGEIKKGIFSVLNFILPKEENVLSMHCSANVGKKGDTALFFGLSGTGKTTLSTDENRKLIGDDEHGWSKESVFNFEGGCYAKTINLSSTKEPQIYRAIKFGAMLENIGFKDEDNRIVDFEDNSITENTRVSYPIDHIDNIVYNSRGDIPENIFFLTCDAFGVLPPISKLTKEQAMQYFLLGYTAKIAGTEAGIVEPQATFSACFGAPFLPLPATKYAELLGEKLEKGNQRTGRPIEVWLVNTGWSGGAYGAGSRLELPYTRAMIKAALDGEFDNIKFKKDSTFGLSIPTNCPDVPKAILDPRDTWPNEEEYDAQAKILLDLFNKNSVKFESFFAKS